MPRAAGCLWRPSTALPSWYGAGGARMSFGCSMERGVPKAADPHSHPLSSLQSLESRLALCSSTSRKLIQKYFSNRIQEQVGVRTGLPHLPDTASPQPPSVLALSAMVLPQCWGLWHLGGCPQDSITLPLPCCAAGHQLREVRGCDHQSAVPPFGAETARGGAQCCQPHPIGLQR